MKEWDVQIINFNKGSMNNGRSVGRTNGEIRKKKNPCIKGVKGKKKKIASL